MVLKKLGSIFLFSVLKTTSECNLPFAFVLLTGNGRDREAQGLAEGEGCPHKAQGDKDDESGLD